MRAGGGFDPSRRQGYRVDGVESELLERQTRNLLKKVNQAIRDYGLIDADDRIAVAVSGGKDSLVLLRLLLAYRETQHRRLPLTAVHVVVEGASGSQEVARAVEAHCRVLDVPFVARPLALNADEAWPLTCQRCAWNRRKTLFALAGELGCNKVAMGHHADDVAQTVLLNLLYQSRVQGIAPKRAFFDGRVAIIRPLVLLPEKQIALFARRAGYPLGRIDCPAAEDSARTFAADLLRQIEKKVPRVRASLRRAAEAAGGEDND